VGTGWVHDLKKWLAFIWVGALVATLLGTGYVLFRFWHYMHEVPEMWKRLEIFDWAVVLFATAVYFTVDYCRLYLLLRILGIRLPFPLGLRVVFVSDFAAVLTPTAELHVPAAVLALADAKVPTDKATAAVTMKTAIGIIWVCVTSVTMLLGYGHIHVPRLLMNNMHFVVIPVGAILLFYAFSVIFSQRLLKWSRRERRATWQTRFFRWLGKSVGDVNVLGTSTRIEHLLTHLLSIGYVFVYAFIGYWLCRAMKLNVEPLTALTIFSTSLMVDYVAPIPGSIGVTEFITAYMIDPDLSPQAIFVALVLRICCKYSVIIPGAVASLAIFQRRGLQAFKEATAQRTFQPPPKPVG
jgi:uncharacterized protein (TIRG00374 family)